jgi:autoinducer 2-degrading protein
VAESGPFTVVVAFRARSAHVDEVVAEISRNARDSLTEPGCEEFAVLRDASDDGAFLLYERYRDEQAFRVEHRATEHYARWRAVAQRCLEPGSEERRELRPLPLR